MRLLMLLCLLYTCCIGQAQTPLLSPENPWIEVDSIDQVFNNLPRLNASVDSTIIEKIFLEQQGLSLQKIGKPPTTALEIESFYAGGQSASYFGSGLFSNIIAEQKIEVAGLPMQLNGNLVLQQNQINRRLSGFSLNFDYETFISRYRDKINREALQEHIKQLSTEQKNALLNRVNANQLQTKVLSPVYQQAKVKLLHTLDSIRDRNMVSGQDSVVLDSLKTLKNKADRYEERIDSIYRASLQQEAVIQQTVNTWRRKWEDIQNNIDVQAMEGNLSRYAQRFLPTKGIKSLLLSVTQLKLGSFRLNSSALDISSVPLNGFSTEIRRKGYYFSTSIGIEGRQRRGLPDYVRNYRLAGAGRRIVQLKAGLGMPETTHLHLSFAGIKVPAGELDSGAQTFPRRNVLLSLDGRYLTPQGIFADIIVGLSNSDFTGSSSTKELLQTLYTRHDIGDNLATLFRSGWRNKKGQTEMSIGYQHVGSNYTTLGNLFLLNNRNSIRLDAKQNFLNSKGQLKLSYLYGISLSSQELYPGVRQQQIAGELSYRLDKRGSRIWSGYSPTYYIQQGAGSGTAVYQLNLASVGAQVVYPHKQDKDKQWISVVQLTNYQDQSEYGDSSTVSGLGYGMISQQYLSGRYNCLANISTGVDLHHLKKIRDFNGEFSQGIDFSWGSLQQGVQVTRRFYDAGWLAGGMAGIQVKTKQKISFGTGMTYLWALQAGTKNQFYINAHIGWMF